MKDGDRLLIFICRGHGNTGKDELTSKGEGEIRLAARKCARFDFIPDTTDILTSPSEKERLSAMIVMREFSLGDPRPIPWLNDANVATHIIGGGLLQFSNKKIVIVILEKPVLEKIVSFCGDLSTHNLQSGDVYILEYPDGKLQKLI